MQQLAAKVAQLHIPPAIILKRNNFYTMSKDKQSLITQKLTIPAQLIERRIYLIRGEKVMLDEDLAELYQVETKMLNRAVKRNLDRFPQDFMFELSKEEYESLRYQIGTSKGKGGRRYIPYAFTEQGIAMLSSVLNSKRAIQVNIAIMRAFVQFRKLMADNEKLARQVAELEKTTSKHSIEITSIFEAIKKLIKAQVPIDEPNKKRIGFRTEG